MAPLSSFGDGIVTPHGRSSRGSGNGSGSGEWQRERQREQQRERQGEQQRAAAAAAAANVLQANSHRGSDISASS